MAEKERKVLHTVMLLPSGNSILIDAFSSAVGCERIVQYMVDPSGNRIGAMTCTCSCTSGTITTTASKSCENGCAGCDCSTPSEPKVLCG